ncbi:helix-turn-helix domain-containing protein [Streptomyces netropsis]
MSEDPEPEDGAEYFGREIKYAREAKGWSQQTLAAKLHCGQPYVSKVEGGKQLASRQFAEQCDVVFGTPGVYTRLRERVAQAGHPSWFALFVKLERDALVMRVYESQIVPGLLQTEEYARAMLEAVRPDNLDNLVAARMSRQQVLARDEPPHCWFIMDEQALRRPIGGREVWRAQLEHLLAAGKHPRSVIQVVPHAVPAHPGLSGAFTLLSFANGTPGALYADGFPEGRTTEEASQVADAERAYALLMSVAVSHDASAALIAKYLKELGP